MIFGGDKTTLRTGVSGGRDSVDMSCFARGAREKFLGFYSLAWDTYGPPRFAWMGFQDCSLGGATHRARIRVSSKGHASIAARAILIELRS